MKSIFFLLMVFGLASCATTDKGVTEGLAGINYGGSLKAVKTENPLYLEHNFIPCWNKIDCFPSFQLDTDDSIYSELIYINSKEHPDHFSRISIKYCGDSGSGAFIGSHKGYPTLLNISKTPTALYASKCVIEDTQLWVVISNTTLAITDESEIIESLIGQINSAVSKIDFMEHVYK